MVPLLASSAAFALVLSLASAQQLISPTLPPCAQQCPILIQAQSACVPPAAPVTNQGIYTSCFCQSNFLAPLKGPQAQLCPTCSPGEMTTIQNWFKGLCNQGNGAPPPQQNGNGQSTPSTTSRTTSPTSIAPAATNSGVRLTQANEPNEAQKGWMSTHWRWVLMLIILALGLSGLAYGGWWYRRRYHRKKAEEEAGPRPDFSVWGPGNSVHDVQDFGSGGQGAASAQRDKGKSREMAEVQAAPESSGRRLKSLRRN